MNSTHLLTRFSIVLLAMILLGALLTTMAQAQPSTASDPAPAPQQDSGGDDGGSGSSEPRDDMYVSCSGGGTVDAGTTVTVRCEIENDTGYNVSWSTSETGGVVYLSKSLGSPNSYGSRIGTVRVRVDDDGTLTVRAQDHEDWDSDSVDFTARAPQPPPTPEPTPEPPPEPTPEPTVAPPPSNPSVAIRNLADTMDAGTSDPFTVRATGLDRSLGYRISISTASPDIGFDSGREPEREPVIVVSGESLNVGRDGTRTLCGTGVQGTGVFSGRTSYNWSLTLDACRGGSGTLTARLYEVDEDEGEEEQLDSDRHTVTVIGPDLPIIQIEREPNVRRVTEGSDVRFRLTANMAPDSNLRLRVGVSQHNGPFLSGTPPTRVTFARNQTSAWLTLGTDDDMVDEPNGSVTATLVDDDAVPQTYVVGARSSSTMLVDDNDPQSLPLPDAPPGFGLAVSGTTVTASWTSPGNGVSRYELQYRTDTPGSWNTVYPSSSSTSHAVAVTTCGTYEFRIRAEGDGATLSAEWGPWSATREAGVCLDLTPAFGEATAPDQTYELGESVSYTLPEATGGNPPLEYSLVRTDGGALPAGLTFDPAARTITGTPTAVTAEAAYIYTVTDSDATNPDSDTLAFTITVNEETLPPPVRPTGLSATKLSNERVALDWDDAAHATGYELEVWSATGGLTQLPAEPFTLTCSGLDPAATDPVCAGSMATVDGLTGRYYYFFVRSRNASGPSGWATSPVSYEAPEFLWPVPDQTYAVGRPIPTLQLPEATGRDVPMTYSISPDLPAGLTFDATARTITGTPTGPVVATEYTYTATDASTDPDRDRLTFTIAVTDGPPVDLVPAFPPGATIDDQSYRVGRAVATLQLPAAAGGDGTLRYRLTPDLPAGLTFDPSARTITGTPTAESTETTYTYTATDSDAVNPDSATLRFTITVGPNDSVPVFPSTVADQTYTVDRAIITLHLPEATGGDGTLTYSISPALPAGLTFEPMALTITGTPTAITAETTYTYTVTDSDTVDPDTDTLEFTITVVETLPRPGRPTGLGATKLSNERVALDWDDAAHAAGYELVVWNQSIGWTPLPAEPFTLTCVGLDPAATNPVCTESRATIDGLTDRYYYFFIGSRNASGTSRLSSALLVSYAEPEFLEPVSDQTYAAGQPIPTLQLPEATGRDVPMTYSISPDLPASLTFDAAARTITGTPTAASAATTYTYTATDASTNPDRDRLTFSITITDGPPVDLVPAFPPGTTIDDQIYRVGRAVATLRLPAAAGGDGTLRYSITPDLPSGLSFDANTRTMTGTPTAESTETTYTYTAMDSDAVNPDADTIEFTITVSADPVPDFGTQTIHDQTYVVDEAIATLHLPEATGGDGTLTYSISPALPAGLRFNANSRTITGTPTVVTAETTYTYTATDSDATDPDTDIIQFTITVDQTIASPDRPTGLSATKLSNERVAIDWDDATHAAGYEVVAWSETINWTPLPAEPLTLMCSGLDPAATNPVCAESTATVDGLTDRYYYFFVRSRNASGTSGWSSGVLLSYAEPEFLETILDQAYMTGQPIPTLQLPEAIGRDMPMTYSISPDLPIGLTFDAEARTISGTPTSPVEATEYTYTATDASTNPSRDRLTFTITVREPDTAPTFGTAVVPDKRYTTGWEIDEQLPEATGGNGTLTYSITPALQQGLTFDPTTRTITGMVEGRAPADTYTYRVVDSDENFSHEDGDMRTFTIDLVWGWPLSVQEKVFNSDACDTWQGGKDVVNVIWHNGGDPDTVTRKIEEYTGWGSNFDFYRDTHHFRMRTERDAYECEFRAWTHASDDFYADWRWHVRGSPQGFEHPHYGDWSAGAAHYDLRCGLHHSLLFDETRDQIRSAFDEAGHATSLVLMYSGGYKEDFCDGTNHSFSWDGFVAYIDMTIDPPIS